MELPVGGYCVGRTYEANRKLAVLGVFAAAYFFSFFQRVSLAVVASDLTRDLAVGPVGLSLMSSAYFVAYALVQPIAGALSDRVGPRATTSGLLVLGAAGSVLFSLSRGLPSALLARVLVGVGMAGAFVPGMKAISSYYMPSEFARMNGLFVSIGNLGAVFAATPLAYLAAAVGWRSSFALAAALSFALAWLCWAVVKDRPEPFHESPAAPKRAAAAARAGGGGKSMIRELIFSREFWLLGVFLTCKYAAQVTFQALWGVPFLTEVYHVSKARAASVAMMITVGYMVGAPLLGYVSDRSSGGRGKVLLAAAAIFLLTWLPIIIWPGKVPLILLCAVLFVMGLAASSANLALVMVKEALPSSIAGTAVGSANVMNMLGAAAMPSVAAWLISYLGSTERAPEVVYRYSLLPCLVLALIAFVAVVLVGRGGGLRVYRGGTQARQESGRP